MQDIQLDDRVTWVNRAGQPRAGKVIAIVGGARWQASVRTEDGQTLWVPFEHVLSVTRTVSRSEE